jgi:CHASE3 domain sensor protein
MSKKMILIIILLVLIIAVVSFAVFNKRGNLNQNIQQLQPTVWPSFESLNVD